MKLRATIFSVGSPALFLGATALVWACASSPDENRFTFVGFSNAGVLDPDLGQFKARGVSLFLERRCGTLDCHGRSERPLRIFGERGLRLPNEAGLFPYTGSTSDDEVVANYRTVVGLEPEVMTRVVAAHAQGNCGLPGEPEDVPCAERLLLISKPLGCNLTSSHGCSGESKGVEHKGGTVIAPGDDGYACMVTWLQGGADEVRCKQAADAY